MVKMSQNWQFLSTAHLHELTGHDYVSDSESEYEVSMTNILNENSVHPHVNGEIEEGDESAGKSKMGPQMAGGYCGLTQPSWRRKREDAQLAKYPVARWH